MQSRARLDDVVWRRCEVLISSWSKRICCWWQTGVTNFTSRVGRATPTFRFMLYLPVSPFSRLFPSFPFSSLPSFSHSLSSFSHCHSLNIGKPRFTSSITDFRGKAATRNLKMTYAQCTSTNFCFTTNDSSCDADNLPAWKREQLEIRVV